MLKIQRASAGSGKTYTLAKTFILEFISVEQGRQRRLITSPQELLASLRGILAVTFTNKATDEMKNRIVEKLHALAWSAKEAGKIDYLVDFMNDYGWSRAEIHATCRKALDVLLEEYSAFNVSTIDSFFQSILRTFTFESNLDADYQVKIDGEEIYNTGLTSILSDIQSGNHVPPHLANLIRSHMADNVRSGKKWNLLSSVRSKYSPFGELVKQLYNLENEEFKKIRDDLKKYFDDSDGRFRETVDSLEKKISEITESHIKAMLSAVKELKDFMHSNGIEEIKRGSAKITTYITSLHSLNSEKLIPASSWENLDKIKFIPDDVRDESLSDTARQLLRQLFNRAQSVADALNSPESKWWLAVRNTLPRLELVFLLAEEIQKRMAKQGFVQLAETNSLLKQIISDDDTPFIYERIGTQINHYLIDEFQDTSRMQWDNIRPLLAQSLGNNQSNLIIGDAKQSIYRFRNACPDLITTNVKASFPLQTLPEPQQGQKEYTAENSNHRSAHNIVKFNNLFFHFLAKRLDQDWNSKYPENDGGCSEYFSTLYSNIIQPPAAKDKEGFVSIRQVETLQQSLDSTYEIIKQLRSRGYRQRDIAILVRSKDTEEKIVQLIKSKNNLEQNQANPVGFVSESSLKLNSSDAVKIIVNTLKSLLESIRNNASATSADKPATDSATITDNPTDPKQISSDFFFFRSNHPDMSNSECIDSFLREGVDHDLFAELLDKLPSQVLPSLVEGIIDSFVSPELCKRDAAYIGAFQDYVVDYCSLNPADIGSFLRDWNDVSNSLCITSPADTDAVQIMTIHKSKGLEFKCVICPNASYIFEPQTSNVEIMWLPNNLPASLGDSSLLPPIIPVEMQKGLDGTAFHENWKEIHRLVAMDAINMAYVAFTRAVNELYILPVGKESQGRTAQKSLTSYLSSILKDYTLGNTIPDSLPVQHVFTPSQALFETSTDPDSGWLFTLGSEYPEVPGNKTGNDGITHHKIERYLSVVDNCMTNFKPRLTDSAQHLASFDFDLDDDVIAKELESSDDNDDNPRAFGTLMHSILEDIRTPDDLPRALRRMKISGMMPSKQLSEAEAIISEALKHPLAKRWFGSDTKVYNERAFISRGKRDARPDRIVIYPDGAIEIIDYKFGLSTSPGLEKKYRSQIQTYIRTMREAGFTSPIRGYLWYLRKYEIIPISEPVQGI